MDFKAPQEILMNPIGILQGRLVPSETGELQCFPNQSWEKEFELAKSCRLNAIELLVDKKKNSANPLWSDAGLKRLSELSKSNSIKTVSACIDYVMANSLMETRPELIQKTIDEIKATIERVSALGVQFLVVPCFENSDIKTKENKTALSQHVKSLSALLHAKKIKLALETALPGRELAELVDAINDSQVGVCYDTGNTTAFNHDIANDIKLLSKRIIHAHIKDRRKNGGPNVVLGTGDADLAGAFASFQNIGYQGYFVLETVRGDDPLKTARQHIEFIRQHAS